MFRRDQWVRHYTWSGAYCHLEIVGVPCADPPSAAAAVSPACTIVDLRSQAPIFPASAARRLLDA
jgi:hypothetical protein